MNNLMKYYTLSKKDNNAQPKYPVSENRIKCWKVPHNKGKEQTILSKNPQPKFNQIQTQKSTKKVLSKSKSKTNRGITGITIEKPLKGAQSQNNWYRKKNEHFIKVSNDNDSMGIDNSESSSKWNENLIKIPNKASMGHLDKNHDFYNTNSRKLYPYSRPDNDTSTFLNYDLGITKNYTQLGEIENDESLLLQVQAELPSKKEIVNQDNNKDTGKEAINPVNEMEIDLSKVSIKLNSFLHWTTIRSNKNIAKDNSNNNIFSANSIYDADTNEHFEGENINKIYSLTIQEKISPFNLDYCLTDLLAKAKQEKTEIKKRNNNSTFKNSNVKSNEIYSKSHFKKVPISNTNQTNRGCYRLLQNKNKNKHKP